ncbi:MAG: HipA domain-containing protein, partial [Saprospiraceae bacterium]|nr:HipA domain-containing protein [Saprospiraceae bacterium]
MTAMPEKRCLFCYEALDEKETDFHKACSKKIFGKTIVALSTNPGLDLINFFELVVFSFLTGNKDMHLKNFSLFKNPELGYIPKRKWF